MSFVQWTEAEVLNILKVKYRFNLANGYVTARHACYIMNRCQYILINKF